MANKIKQQSNISVSRNIPYEVERKVRQECYFGCVICGMPIFEYDHIIEYSQVNDHKVDNLVLLCPTHHSMKTTGKLSLDKVKYARANPFNKLNKFTASAKIESALDIDIVVGTNVVKWSNWDDNKEHIVFWINGKSFFSIHLEDGWYTLSLILTDATGKILLLVDKGELVVSAKEWDYEYKGTTLIIRAGKGKLLLKLELASNLINVRKGAFMTPNGDGFTVEYDYVRLHGEGIERMQTLRRCYISSNYGSFAVRNKRSFTKPDYPEGFAIIGNYHYD